MEFVLATEVNVANIVLINFSISNHTVPSNTHQPVHIMFCGQHGAL